MSQPDYRSSPPSGSDGDSPFLTAMLGVAAVFILAAIIVLWYCLRSWYGADIWGPTGPVGP